MIEKFKSPIVQNFILQHQHDDLAMLMLKSKKFPDFPVKEIIQQIQSRQKAKQKLPEWYGKKGVIFPQPLSIEQASSEITAKYKASLVCGESFVDLTGGTGIDTFYFSKSFSQNYYIERNAHLCEIARHNFNLFSVSVTVHNLSAEEFLLSIKDSFDFVYVDPARRDNNTNKVFLLQDCEPDVAAIQTKLLEKGKKVMLKTSPMLDLQQADSLLSNLRAVHVVAVGNEVKEVLYLLERNWEGQSEIHAVNLNKSTGEIVEAFSFSKEEEQNTEIEFRYPSRYIYEPNKSILKAGAFKSAGNRFRLAKLHPNSHLYTSDELFPFSGRSFELVASVPYHKKAILSSLPNKKANITTRNFPDSVAEIRKKTGIKEGGELFLFATTNMENKLVILICKKIPDQKAVR